MDLTPGFSLWMIRLGGHESAIMQNQMQQLGAHSYEEIRDVLVDILTGREKVDYEPSQFRNLISGAAEVLVRRGASVEQHPHYGSPNEVRLHPRDTELVRDVFWDLFRQGFITLGLNDNNEAWPWFRLSHFAQETLKAERPYRFHDAGSFIKLVRDEAPDISIEALVYLEEAVAAFYAGCLLASCVMLGVAAEAEFLRLVDTAAKNTTYGSKFASLASQRFVGQKIKKFRDLLRPLVNVEDLDTNLLAIQSVLRIARNEAGHPTFTKVEREQVYVYLQLFVPFARQIMKLRKALVLGSGGSTTAHQ